MREAVCFSSLTPSVRTHVRLFTRKAALQRTFPSETKRRVGVDERENFQNSRVPESSYATRSIVTAVLFACNLAQSTLWLKLELTFTANQVATWDEVLQSTARSELYRRIEMSTDNGEDEACQEKQSDREYCTLPDCETGLSNWWLRTFPEKIILDRCKLNLRITRYFSYILSLNVFSKLSGRERKSIRTHLPSKRVCTASRLSKKQYRISQSMVRSWL